MLLTILQIFLAITLLCLFLRLSGIKIVGLRSNPFGLFFCLNFFVVSLPGIIIVYSPGIDTFLNAGMMSVSSSVIDYVTYSYAFSLLVIMLMLLASSGISKGFYIRASYFSNISQIKLINRFTVIGMFVNIIFLFVLAVKIGINNVPFVESIWGEMTHAKVLKARLITGEVAKLPESVNQLFRILIPLTAYLAAYQYFSRESIKKQKIVFIGSVFLAFIYYMYDLQKAPVFLFIFGLMFIYSFHRGLSWKLLLILFILTMALLSINAFYFNLTAFEDIFLLIEKVGNRLFIRQNQGMYYIVEFISPSAEYLKNGAIFSSFVFSDVPESADATVMKIMYGDIESNVNMNTYFLGQAYSIAGILGIAFSSVVIGSHLCIYLIIFKKLYKINIAFFMPLSVVFYLFFVPINQGFNSFLYGRNVIFFVVFGLIIYFLYSFQTKNFFKKASVIGLSNET